MYYMLTRVIVALCLLYGTDGVCTYSDINLDLYDCFDTRSLTTEYALPLMASTGDATLFCTTHLSAINTCVETAIQACSGYSKITTFYGDGTGLSAAYSYLCSEYSSNSNVEPFSCATTADVGSVKANLSDFDTAVDALANPTVTEICSLADTLTDSFTSEISSVCSGSSTSIAIWSTYNSKLKSACNGFSSPIASTLLLVLSVFMAIFHQL